MTGPAARFARIEAISYYLPETVLSNAELSAQFPEWSVEKIAKKTGINNRHIVSENQTSSDLAVAAGKKLISEYEVDPQSVDFLIVCTQSPDFLLPTTACLVQEGLKLGNHTGALDVNLGCSGYIYSLGLAKGLIESGQVSSVLLISTDTYSRFVNNDDKSVRTIFGDGAAATLVTASGEQESILGINYGTDGSGARHLMTPGGGMANAERLNIEATAEARGLKSNGFDLYMNGAEVFNFTLRVVPDTIQKSLEKASASMADVDAFVFHQANKFMLDTIRKKVGIPPEKFVVQMADCGNTVSSSIPIALKLALDGNEVEEGDLTLLAGFGVGLSWGSVLVRV